MTLENLKLNKTLLDCVIKSTAEGLAMTGIEPDAVGVSRFSHSQKRFSVILGLHGERNGHVALNLSEHTALFIAGRFLGEEYTELNDDVIDAIGEIGNMIGGVMKTHLLDTKFAIDTISLPALIIGSSYNLYHLKNIDAVSVTFEINEISMMRMDDKFFTTSVAMEVK